MERIVKTAQVIKESPPERWEESLRVGIIVSLFTKRPKKYVDDYMGICLLAPGSRIFARDVAMKLGMWAEKIGILGENPAGFRRGTSMPDVVQVIMSMQEDVEDRRRRVDVSERVLVEVEGSEARHLYLRKALLSVNKSGLWGCWTEMIFDRY